MNSKNRKSSLPASKKSEIEKKLAEQISQTNNTLSSLGINQLKTLSPDDLTKIYNLLYEQGKILWDLKEEARDEATYDELKFQLDTEQGNWQIPSTEEQEINEKMNNWITSWYNQFMKGQKREWVKPLHIKGRKIDDPTEEDIAFFKNEPQFDIPKSPPPINFRGYTGFLDEQGLKNSAEGKTAVGVTNSKVFANQGWTESDGSLDECTYVIKENEIEIKLKQELFFNRLGHDEWISKVTKKGNSWSWNSLDISFDQAVETIAHELSHAVINSTIVDYKGEEGGGHGILHREKERQIEEMMRNSPEFSEFEAWWNEPRPN